MPTLFLAGDVMTGRGIDQVLPHPSPPRLYETCMQSAREYVDLAERANGPVAAPVAWDYVWGDALAVLARKRPDARTAMPVREGGRVLLFSYADGSSGVPWAATARRPGVNRLADLSLRTVEHVAREVTRHRRPGDLVVASIHWGGNWGYAIGRDERAFAHALIDVANVHVVHGHSSHHPKGVELHAGRPILYGCGDFLNDYEGIGGYREFQPELRAMYFPAFDAGGRLARFEIVPMALRRFRIGRADAAQARAFAAMLGRESAKLGTRVEAPADGELSVDIMEHAA